MMKFSALSKGFVNKTVALVVASALSSTASATPLDVTDEADEVTDELAQAGEPTDELVQAEKITDKSHPEYVRCRREAIIGSLARKRKICMTNKQWSEAGKRGNRLAGDMIGAIQGMSGGSTFSNGK